MKTVGIIGGKGLMGSFFAKFFRNEGFRVLISDRKTKLVNQKLAEQSDVILVAVPIDVTEKVIREIIPHTRRGQIFADITSLKTFSVREMLKGKASVIGLHPMFRPGPSGFRGQTIVMCPARCTNKQKQWLRKLFVKNGATVTEMSTREHDELMGIVQALIHFHSLVLGQTLRSLRVNLKKLMQVMSPIYRMQFDVVCRIFAQNPILYASIGMENPTTPKTTKHFLCATEMLRKILLAKNQKAFEREFRKTAAFLGPYSKRALQESDKLIANLSQNTFNI